jgi:hypothetical protein
MSTPEMTLSVSDILEHLASSTIVDMTGLLLLKASQATTISCLRYGEAKSLEHELESLDPFIKNVVVIKTTPKIMIRPHCELALGVRLLSRAPIGLEKLDYEWYEGS